MSELRDLYEEVILDHNRNPRNYPKRPEGTNCSAHGFNPLCGDEFHVHMRVKDGMVEDVGFEGAGCAISTASASLMTEAVKGKPVAEAEKLFEAVHSLLTAESDGVGDNAEDLMGKLAVLAGVREYPMRVKCATLAWHIMNGALHEEDDTVTTE
jgi:nitrogen fixation NifU-like protein